MGLHCDFLQHTEIMVEFLGESWSIEDMENIGGVDVVGSLLDAEPLG